MSKRVSHKISQEDEPHPSRLSEGPWPPGFQETEGDPPTGDGYSEGEPGEEKPNHED